MVSCVAVALNFVYNVSSRLVVLLCLCDSFIIDTTHGYDPLHAILNSDPPESTTSLMYLLFPLVLVFAKEIS